MLSTKIRNYPINNAFFNKIQLDQYDNYQPKKNKTKSKQKKIILNSINKNDNQILNKKSNNSSKNIISLNHYKKQAITKVLHLNSKNHSLNKIKKNKNIIKKDLSSSNKKIKFFRNPHYKNSLNNSLSCFSKTNIDFFNNRYNLYNRKNSNNGKRIKSIESFSKINKQNETKTNMNLSKIFIKDKITNINKINKPNLLKRSKTPILSTKISNNNSKSKNNSKEKKINDKNNYKNRLLYSGINIFNRNSSLKHNIRTKMFQANNIFAQFKPRKKNQTIIHQEELFMKQQKLINKENTTIENNKNNINQRENYNCFIEIHPKIVPQKELENNLIIKKEISNTEILPLTNNSTNINFLSNNNNHSKSNSDIKHSSNLKQQFNNNNHSINNIDIQLQNIHSEISLNNNTFININNNNINSIINNKNSSSLIAQKDLFEGKKIKCIHDISKTGIAGMEKKINQDRDFIFRNFVEGFDNIFMGVCDGHGFFGNEVSEYIKENLPMDLNRIIKTRKLDINKDDLSEVIINTFLMENNALLRNKQIDSDLSGSTCISVIYTPKKLIIANVGDSRCVLGSRFCENNWKFENLSRDHKPNIKEEADRIKKNGGRIRPIIDEDGCFVGPLRVYMKDKDLPGLAMTRSFGDYFASLAGTIAIPEIKEHILIPEDKFIILASDGLFEFINSETVGNIVKGYYEKNDIVGCCEYLYKESYRKWISEEEDTVDDITIILVFFED